MRQVPQYIIIGNGHLATHMRHYFNGLSIQYTHWYREKSLDCLQNLLSDATHVLVLITDNQIEQFIHCHILSNHSKLIVVHFSGALHLKKAYSAHPLQTFPSKKLYPLNQYKRIPFILEYGSPTFEKLLPGLNNPHYFIDPKSKPYYHAMCVLANNFSTLLWQKCYVEMQNRFGIAPEQLTPFLEQTFSNIKHTNGRALSGPIARGDTTTLEKNLTALKDDPFYHLFESVIQQVNCGKIP